jgi:tetratricopeptide (TPR) repeat protein
MNHSEAKPLKLQGRAYTESGQDEKAVEVYRLSLADDPYDAETHNWLGIALENLGLREAAIESYGKAIGMDPVYEKALYNRGMALNQTGNFPASIEDFTAVVNMNSPVSQRARMQRKWAYQLLMVEIQETHTGNETVVSVGQSGTALNRLDELIRRNPKEPDSYYYRGIAAASSGRYEEAIEDFSKAIGLGFEEVNVLYDRGRSYLLACNKGGSRDYLDWAIEDLTNSLQFEDLGAEERLYILSLRESAQIRLSQLESPNQIKGGSQSKL